MELPTEPVYWMSKWLSKRLCMCCYLCWCLLFCRYLAVMC